MALKNIALVGTCYPPWPHSLSPQVHRHCALPANSTAALKKVDYNNHVSLVEALKGQDAVVTAIAGEATADQTKIIDAAVEAGVKRFVPTEYGVDTSNPAAVEKVPFFKIKENMKKYLEEKAERGLIEWTSFITGAFFDWGLKVGFLGFNISTATATLDPAYRTTKLSASNLSLIGQAVAQALSPSIAPKTVNKVIYVRSFTISQDDILAAFEKVSGEKWTVEAVDFAPKVKEAQEKAQKGDFSGVALLIQSVILDKNFGNNWDARGLVGNELLELPKEDLEGAIRQLLA